MNEWVRTIGLGVIAGILVLVGVFTAPKTVNPDMFSAEGEMFYPEFTDPSTVKSLEVSTFYSKKGTPRTFKVSFENGKWVIPSHDNYPADAEDRIRTTAFALVDLKKDLLYSDRKEDHEKFNVLDPLDPEPGLDHGYGKRVTLYHESGNVLADYILGTAVPKKGKKSIPGKVLERNPQTGRMEEKDQSLELTLRYVRVPGKKQTYGAWTSADVSSRFSDWIESGLLQLEKDHVSRLTLNPYRIKEQPFTIDMSTGRLFERSKIIEWNPFILGKDSEGKWALGDTGIEQDPVNTLLSTLKDLVIVGVRRKPPSLTRDLEIAKGIRLDQETVSSLRSKGFYILPKDNGKGEILASNEGELDVATEDGVVYSLRFGDILFGEGEAITAGSGKAGKDSGDEGKEHRYIFIMAGFDASLLPLPAPTEKPAMEGPLENDPRLDFDARRALLEEHAQNLHEWQEKNDADMKEKKKAWEEKVARGKKKAKELNDRFASWYYVISGEDFKKIHLTRKDLLKK